MMNQLLTIGTPIIAVVVVTIFLVREHYRNKNKGFFVELKKDAQQQTLPLRISAYERLVLFTERISPSSLLVRIQSVGMTASEMQAACLNEVRTEFEHNLSQQLFVSEIAWQMIKKTKDETMLMFHTVGAVLPADALALDFSRSVLEYVGKMPADPYSKATAALRAEVAKLF